MNHEPTGKCDKNKLMTDKTGKQANNYFEWVVFNSKKVLAIIYRTTKSVRLCAVHGFFRRCSGYSLVTFNKTVCHTASTFRLWALIFIPMWLRYDVLEWRHFLLLLLSAETGDAWSMPTEIIKTDPLLKTLTQRFANMLSPMMIHVLCKQSNWVQMGDKPRDQIKNSIAHFNINRTINFAKCRRLKMMPPPAGMDRPHNWAALRTYERNWAGEYAGQMSLLRVECLLNEDNCIVKWSAYFKWLKLQFSKKGYTRPEKRKWINKLLHLEAHVQMQTQAAHTHTST